MPELRIYTTVSRVEVSCLPATHRARRHFTITAELRNHAEDQWAVCWSGCVFDAEGNAHVEPSPSNRDDTWLGAHRFPYHQAIGLAWRLVSTLEVNGKSVQFALDHPDWR